ncbi:MAG: single-stranded DNA-binding protein [Planctomycetota bacterium]|jgi:single-strand DNA-binding protein
MPGFNQVVLMGKLVKEPRLNYANGLPVCNLRLYVPRFYKSKDGTQKNDSLFIDVVVWRRMAEVCHQALHKDSQIMVSGRLQMNDWTGNDGLRRLSYRVQSERIQFLQRKPAEAETEDHAEEGGEASESEAA